MIILNRNKKKKENTPIAQNNNEKNVLNTAGYLGMNVLSGATSVAEGIADIGAVILKGTGKVTSKLVDNKVGEFIFGKEAGDYRNNPLYQLGESMVKDEVANTVSEIAEDKVGKKSYFDNNSLPTQIARGVGQVAGSVLIGKASGTIGNIPSNTSSNTINTLAKGLNEPTIQNLFISTAGNSYTEAIKEGAKESDAVLYGLIEGAKETATELMYGGIGGAFGSGALDDVVKGALTEKIRNKVLKKGVELGLDMTFEGAEEVVATLLEPFTSYVYKHELDFSSYDTILNDFISGALVSGAFQGGQITVDKTIEKAVNTYNEIIKENEINTTRKNIIDEIEKNKGDSISNTNKNRINELIDEELNNNNAIDSDNVIRLFTSEQSAKKQNLLDSANEYFDTNSTITNNLIETLNKIIDDKGYDITFDSSIGEDVNGVNINGNTIKINPNTEDAIEKIVMHELTHSISTPEMQSIIDKYIKKNPDFKDSLKSLAKTYKTDDINGEVLAELVGQIFGNQEFIISLSNEEPSLYKKVRNNLISISNILTGSKNKSLFIDTLRAKLEQAYRGTNTYNNNTSFSRNNLVDKGLYLDYNNSIQQIPENILSYIIAEPEKYNYLKYSQSEDFFELNLSEMKKAIKLCSQSALIDYKNGETKGLNNSDKYVYYYDVYSEEYFGITRVDSIEEMEEIKNAGIKGKNSNRTMENSKYGNENNNRNIESIENRESSNNDVGMARGRKSEKIQSSNRKSNGNNRELDNSSFSLEKIAEKRFKDSIKETEDIIDYFQNYLDENGIDNPTLEDMYNSIDSYEVLDATGSFHPEEEQRYFNTIKEHFFSDNKKYSLKEKKDTNDTYDNQGRKLSVRQQKYFENSKARVGENLNNELVRVYHTMTNEGVQFNEFNPVGTERYRFGEQVVNYFTDDKDMSGSYANQNYQMANTKRLRTIKQVEDFIKEVNEYDGYHEVQLEQDGEKYKLINNSKLANSDKTRNDLYKEVIDYKNSLTKEELEQYKDMHKYIGSNAFTVEAYLHDRGYSYGSEQDRIAQKFNREVLNQNYYSYSIYDNVLFRNITADIIHTFENKQDLFRNLKETLARTGYIATPEPFNAYSKKQYEGYVNITNPYIVDAEERAWHNVSKSIDEKKVNEALQIDDETKYNLITLAQRSEDGYYRNLDKNRQFQYISDALNKLPRDEQYNVTMNEPLNNPKEKITYYNWVSSVVEETYEEFQKKYQDGIRTYLDYKNPDTYFYRNLSEVYHTDYIEPKELFELAQQEFTDIIGEDFNQEYYENIFKTKNSTNDVVKQVIEMNKNGASYDGIIFKNVYDYGGHTDKTMTPNNLYVTFNSNQFKALDNTSPSKDNDIRYSQETPTSFQKYLNDNFKASGTRTYSKDIKLPITESDIDKTKLSVEELEEFNNLKYMDRAFGLTDSEQKRFDYLIDKGKGLIKYSTLKNNVKFDDIKSDYNKYKDLSDFNNSLIKKAESFIPDFRNSGRRTKEQWIGIAEFIGSNINTKTDEELKKYAIQSWFYTHPNNKENLNRQGNKFVKFSIDEWINAVYKGAGVGTKIKETNEAPLLKNNPVLVKQNKTEIPKNPTLESTYEEETEPLAKILDERPINEEKKESRLKKLFTTKIIDKGYYVDKLARKTNNKELSSKYDYMLMANGIGQQIIGNKRYNPKTQKIVGKGLFEIFTPIENSGMLEEFSNYIYHKHNISRMSLDKLFQEDNKPVFGYSITSDKSKTIAEEYEKAHPEFLEWAKEIYDYNNYLLDILVDYDIISSDERNYYKKKYPYYVPTIRDMQDEKFVKTDDEKKIRVNSTIKKAYGSNRDIIPLKEAMSIRTMQTINSALRNNFGNELLESLMIEAEKTENNVDDLIETEIDNQNFVTKGNNLTPATLTIFKNGERLKFEIDDEIYEALAPRERITSKILNNISRFRRALITEYNPAFMLTNPIKDVQDGILNSKHPLLFSKNIVEATKQIQNKGELYKLYVANGGNYETYFNYDEGYNKFPVTQRKVNPIKILNKISEINERIEMTPRLAEFISSIEAGDTIETAMYNAQEITTNFKRGGNWTKNLDSNGFTFLNASFQGAYKQIKNIQEAKNNGIKGITSLSVKWCLAGAIPYILNSIIWDDDEEYEELSDYVKNNYYVLWKNSNGTFLRIPKGRFISAIQNVFSQLLDATKGKKINVSEFVNLMQNQVLPNDPLENNIFSPLLNVVQNKTWYGSDLVPSRLQAYPVKEQFDESTDSISKWLGNKLGISPIKINYILDQYSGAIGDLILPALTLEAENDSNTFFSYMASPLKSKFTTNSIINNQNISDLYSLVDELTANAKSSNATEEDRLKSKFINSIQAEMNQLTAEKRTIQNDESLSNNEKYKQVLEIQKQINNLAKNGLENYEDYEIYDNYARVGDREYTYNSEEDEWTKINSTKTSYKVGNQIAPYKDYLTYKEEIEKIRKEYTNTSERKNNTINYINSLPLSIPQKAMLIKSYYSSYKNYDSDIVEYISNNNDLSYEDKEDILDRMGFTVVDGEVYYKK